MCEVCHNLFDARRLSKSSESSTGVLPGNSLRGVATGIDEMQSSLATLRAVQAARAVAVPELATEPAPLATQLEAFRKRNAALDALF